MKDLHEVTSHPSVLPQGFRITDSEGIFSSAPTLVQHWAALASEHLNSGFDVTLVWLSIFKYLHIDSRCLAIGWKMDQFWLHCLCSMHSRLYTHSPGSNPSKEMGDYFHIEHEYNGFGPVTAWWWCLQRFEFH